MTPQERKKLNQRIGAIVHGKLKLDEETYRTIVSCIDEKSEGHITRCDDEHANLVLLALQKMVERPGMTSVTLKNQQQQKFIARLMDYLGWDWKHTAEFCWHQTGRKSTRACSAGELSKIIIGMIRIIDERIEKGVICLSKQELETYHRYTRLHRENGQTKLLQQK